MIKGAWVRFDLLDNYLKLFIFHNILNLLHIKFTSVYLFV